MRCRLVKNALAVVFLFIATIALAGGSYNEDVPTDSWVYNAVFELSSRGAFGDLLLHTRPYSRGDVADGLRAIVTRDSVLTTGEWILVEKLRREFAEELSLEKGLRSDTSQYVRLGGGPTARSDQSRHVYAKNRAGLDAIGSFGVGRTFAARMRVRFDTDGRQDTQFHGEYWKQKFTAWVEQAVMTLRYRRVRVAFGREYWRWGRSPNDAMLISDHAPPFDGLRVAYRAPTWAFSFYATMLDSMRVVSGSANRYLVGHRFDWRPRHNLELAVSEVIVYGGVGRPWGWIYLNPVLPYYWEQLNGPHTNDNPLWNLEISWRPRRWLELYGEWMIDDFQIDFASEPQQIGVLAGVVWSGGPGGRLSVNAEYERINTFVYGQALPYNRYFHDYDLNNRPIGIGSNLGTDADRLTVRPLWHQSRLLDLRAALEYVRHGVNQIDSVQEVAVPKGLQFPSGVVDRHLTIGVGGRFQAGGNLVFDVLAGYEHRTNIGNQRGVDQQGGFLQLRFVALMWKTFGV